MKALIIVICVFVVDFRELATLICKYPVRIDIACSWYGDFATIRISDTSTKLDITGPAKFMFLINTLRLFDRFKISTQNLSVGPC